MVFVREEVGLTADMRIGSLKNVPTLTEQGVPVAEIRANRIA